MITDAAQITATLDRIAWFQSQVTQLRRTESNPANHKAAAGGFLDETDRMQREVREYLATHPAELVHVA